MDAHHRRIAAAAVPHTLMAGAEGFWEPGEDYTDPVTYDCRDWADVNPRDFAQAAILIDAMKELDEM